MKNINTSNNKNLFAFTIILIIISILILLYSTLVRKEEILQPSVIPRNSSNDLFPSLYFAPKNTLNKEQKNTNPLLIQESTMIADGITLVSSKEQLVYILKRYPQLATLYLHPDTIQLIDSDWLHQQYENGIVVVALNTPHSVLGKKLGVHPQFTDIPASRVQKAQQLNRRVITFSVYYRYNNRLGGADIEGQVTDLIMDFDTLPQALNTFPQQIAQIKNESPVPLKIAHSKMSLQEKFTALYDWLSAGCPLHSC